MNDIIATRVRIAPGLTARGEATLSARRQDRALARKHLRAERAGDLTRQEARRHLAFLQAVLADTDTRTVWWIDEHPDRLGELGELNEGLKDVKPPHERTQDVLRDEISRFTDRLFTDLHTPQQKEVFLRALTQTLQSLGSPELRATADAWLTAVRAPDHHENGPQ
ncbi:hypothetical protein ADK54_21440 [Streptomyces sp. WM6378]|nr:hypothetical protein ADK54_21440 [Streptomyces sp. WM6378]